MLVDDDVAYRALKARDARFDGVFFVGVSSTGIYCRPVCPARVARREHCRFFASAGAAEKAGFRPCLRCRPELAPGHAPVDQAQRLAAAMLHRVDEGFADEAVGLEDIAAEFGVSSRQLRRVVQQELGVSPMELIQTRRLLLAKQLLTETALSVIDVAFASGFASLRRFNAAFRARYRMPPSRLRSLAAQGGSSAATSSTLLLCYRPPYDWEGMLQFLQGRMLQGVECVEAGTYARTVRLGTCVGWVRVSHVPEKRALAVEFAHSLVPVLPALLGRLRALFDLSARPDVISQHLVEDALLRKAVLASPGLRVPGAFDGFEMTVRAILGQQITVKAATRLACRFVEAFGEETVTPVAGLTRLSPQPEVVARASLEAVASLGIIRTRAACMVAVAEAFRSGALVLDEGTLPEAAIEQLVALPGIGPWTAHYVAMRALRWTDAFPKEDVAVRNRLGGVTAREAEALSQRWRPWRSYAVLHVWNMGSH